MSVLLSVIVPVYKTEKYLDKCINSIVNQTYKNLEIILVDDGSPDNCPQMCDEWAKKDGRIKVIHKENGGVSSARNCGLDIAVGEYVAFVDADDYAEPNMYEVLLQGLEEYNVPVAECSVFREYENGTTERWGNADAEYEYVNKEDVLKRLLLSRDLLIMSTWNKLFRSEAINSIRFDESIRINEDLLFVFQVFSNIDRHIFINKSLYHYIYRISSASHKKNQEAMFDELKVLDELKNISPDSLMQYCIYGDVIRSFSKLQELLVSDSLTEEVFSFLRKRILDNKEFVFSSPIVTSAIKFKTKVLLLFPLMFRIFYRLFAKYVHKKIQKKAL